MVDFSLTEQQMMLRNTVRKFVREEVIPVRDHLDREPDPKKGFSWDLLRKADALGLRTLSLSEADGGIGADIVTRCVVGEEMAVDRAGGAVHGIFVGIDERFGLLLRQGADTRLVPLSDLLEG